QEYWQKARDPIRSKELYRELGGYQTFTSAPSLFATPNVLIRREYEAAWRDMETAFLTGRAYFETTDGPSRYEGHAIPGPRAPYPSAYTILGNSVPLYAGKTIFLSLALLRCLGRHWTVFLQLFPYAETVYIFNSAGVFQLNAADVNSPALREAPPRATWFLVDSSTTLHSVPRDIYKVNRFLIQAASPQTDRARWTNKNNYFRSVYLMNPMPLEEVQLSYSLAATRTEDTDRITDSFFAKYGPSTRLAHRAASAGKLWEVQPAAAIVAALGDLDLLKLREFVFQTIHIQLRMDDNVSHHLLLTRPGDERHQVQVDVVSDHVLVQLFSALSRPQRLNIQAFFDLAASITETRTSASHLLEWRMQDRGHDLS
ncbi:hypothetical protein BD626DRAFT_391187, partial [Schizophyllum amplum]